MPDFDYLRETRDGYDATASAYAETFHEHLRDKPIDRAMLSAFAGLLEPGDLVADVGCGTGAATRILAAVGLRVVGVDLSANMIGEARRLNPGLRAATRSGGYALLAFQVATGRGCWARRSASG
nr:class I SAM-dependent methyltransferase [Mycolicibacterium malmesburyense]CRL72421.1 methyltransferase [Mycolicibacterium malmesburyense]